MKYVKNNYEIQLFLSGLKCCIRARARKGVFKVVLAIRAGKLTNYLEHVLER